MANCLTAILGQKIRKKLEFLIFRGVKNSPKSDFFWDPKNGQFFLGCIDVKLGSGYDNTKYSTELESGWVLTIRAQLSTFPQPNQ